MFSATPCASASSGNDDAGEISLLFRCSAASRDTACGDLTAYEGVLKGDRFMRDWREDNLKNLFTTIKNTMPRGAPASLTDGVDIDIAAYILKSNDFPEGKTELTPDSFAAVQIQGKGGPDVVPDYAIVQTVRCLSQRADMRWIVTCASEPRRTRNPDKSTSDELAAADSISPGTHTYRLLSAASYDPAAQAGHKVEAKGLLIRYPGDDRLNTSSIRTVAKTCAP